MRGVPRRKRDIEASIAETLELIREYEAKRRLSDDPRAKRDCERQIAALRLELERYQTELDTLPQILPAANPSLPPTLPTPTHCRPTLPGEWPNGGCSPPG
jgi:hypothetical protein